ncbi:MAG: TetR/AcrR family transcriptional regulator [Xanthobacteraceae bacterium]
MAYRRTERVNERLAARRAEIILAARETAAEQGLAAVQIAPVAARARIAAGTVYRYFPDKADLLAAVLSHIQQSELAAIRAAAERAPGPLSALAAAVVTFAVRAIERPRLIAAALTPRADLPSPAAEADFRRAIAAELEVRIDTAISAGALPKQDAPDSAAHVLGALAEGTVGPLARPTFDSAQRRASVLAAALFALRGLGISDARARGLIIQAPTILGP